MVIENKTNLSSEDCYDILEKNARFEYIKKAWVTIVIFAVGIPIMVMGLVNKDVMYIVLGAIFIAISFAFWIVTLINIKRLPKMIYKRNKDICDSGALYEYRFRENVCEIVIKSGTKTNKMKLEYTNIRKINEFENHYQIKFYDDFVIYVSKAGFESKKHEELFRKNISNNGDKKKKHKIVLKTKEK